MGFLDHFRTRRPDGGPPSSPLPPPRPGDLQQQAPQPAAPPPPSPSSLPSTPQPAGPTLPDGPRVDVVGESYYRKAYMELFGRSDDWRRFNDVIAELVPEPNNEYDPKAVAVKIGGMKIGHVPREDAHALRVAIDEAIAHHGQATARADVGCAPTGNSPYASEYWVSLWVSDRPVVGAQAAADEIRLADGGPVSVSNEEHYQDILTGATNGRDVDNRPYPVIATLVRDDAGNPWAKNPTGPIVTVKIGHDTVGYLTRAMTDRYLRFVDEAAELGKQLTAAGLIKQGTRAGKRILEITLDAVPRRSDQHTIDTLDVDVIPSLVVHPKTQTVHQIDGQLPDGSWETGCGLKIESSAADLIGDTKPRVGLVEMTSGRIYDYRYPRCDRC